MLKSIIYKNREMLVLGCSQLFFGIVGALLVQVLFTWKSPVTIATVNITGLEDSFIRETSKQALSPSEMKQKVSIFAKNLNQSVVEVAKQKHVILMPSEAVIAGSHDLTGEIAHRLSREVST